MILGEPSGTPWTRCCDEDRIEEPHLVRWTRIRGESPFDIAVYRREGDDPEPTIPRAPRTAWEAVAREVRRCPGFLVELVLDPAQGPGEAIAALAAEFPGSMEVTVLASGPIPTGIFGEYELTTDPECLVIYMDSDIHGPLSDLIVEEREAVTDDGEVETVLADGPLSIYGHPGWGPLSQYSFATGLVLNDLFRELRQIAEDHAFRIVVVTTDARSVRGRLMSHIGDAGRYFSGLRLFVENATRAVHYEERVRTWSEGDEEHQTITHARVEHETWPSTVATWKDEKEGRTGRLLGRFPCPS